jgi:glutathione S-transferase
MTKTLATIIGSYPSPFVRKVLTLCEIKGVPFAIDPIVPFLGGDAFTQLSPLRRVPVFIDDQVTLADSSVICQYLEDRYPEPRVYPADIADRARARWMEEFADTRLADVCIWKIFFPATVKPHVFGGARDLESVGRAVREELPDVLAYLETQAPDDDFVFGEISIADFAVAVHFSNLRWARVEPEAALAPKTLAWIKRVQAHPALARVNAIGDEAVRTPLPGHRALLARHGVAVTEESLGVLKARRGPMTVAFLESEPTSA